MANVNYLTPRPNVAQFSVRTGSKPEKNNLGTQTLTTQQYMGFQQKNVLTVLCLEILSIITSHNDGSMITNK